MPRLLTGNNNNNNNGYESDNDVEDLIDAGRQRVRRVWDGFIDFAFQGNVLEIAFGLILASMFTAVMTSFVSDIILPPLSVLLPLNKNLDEKFAILKGGPHAKYGYNTVKAAQDDGAVVMAYGFFLNRLINFVGVGFSLYGMASIYQYFSKDPIIKRTVKCKYCRKYISEKASRCVNCTSWQDGRDDRQPREDHLQ
ncbi:Large-conductance mechanosensitive channel [Naviculisporaceae sp. PSN 640]